MRKAIIWGCGNIGEICYEKIRDDFDVLAWTDSNKVLWNSEKKGIKIIPPAAISEYLSSDEIFCFIAIEDAQVSQNICKDLHQNGYGNIYIWKRPFFYLNRGMIPYRSGEQSIYSSNELNKNVLFVSSQPGIRDHKMAALCNTDGWHVSLACYMIPTVSSRTEFSDIYERVYSVRSIEEIVKLVKGSNYAIIHCSSEPEFTDIVLSKTGVPTVFDCHDFNSITRAMMSPDAMAIEYLAHSLADGVIYPSEGLREEGIRRFGLSHEYTCVFGGNVSRSLRPKKRLKKLSERDGQIHAVYEGLIVERPEYSKKYYEKLWKIIAEAGIQIHFYSPCNYSYCKHMEAIHPNIHYEGNYSSVQLAEIMSQYDVGLCMFNDNPLTHVYLEYGSPLKLFEYINAGLPVAIGNIKSTYEFVSKFGVGDIVRLDDDIYGQIKKISEITIPPDFFEIHKLYLEDQASELFDLYERLINRRTPCT